VIKKERIEKEDKKGIVPRKLWNPCNRIQNPYIGSNIEAYNGQKLTMNS
jgi:hypothetical protein